MSSPGHDPKKQVLEDSSPHYPPSLENNLQQAMELHEKGELEQAAALYSHVLAQRPENLIARCNLGIIQHSRGNLPAAIEQYLDVLDRDAGNFMAMSSLACACADIGNFEDAITYYRRSLGIEPEHAGIHFRLGLIYYQEKQATNAVVCFELAIKYDPGHFQSWYNLGVIHQEKGRFESAINCYRQALRLESDDSDGLYNLAVVLAETARYEEAAVHFTQALQLEPDNAKICNSLGAVYKNLNIIDRAEYYFTKAVTIRPDYAEALKNLGVISNIKGDRTAAAEYFRRVIALGHDVEAARFMLSALTGERRESAPEDYVRTLFDSYADRFDEDLTVNLRYRAPRQLREMIREIAPDIEFSELLDLGCGTGLSGEAFADLHGKLTGVDISDEMLRRAAEKKIYTQLYCREIIDYLENTSDEFDLVVAADVLIYIGRLDSFFQALARCCRSGAMLAFSTEFCPDEEDFQLRRSGRYAHSTSYINRMAAGHGFEIIARRSEKLRKEKGEWIQGTLFLLRRV